MKKWKDDVKLTNDFDFPLPVSVHLEALEYRSFMINFELISGYLI